VLPGSGDRTGFFLSLETQLTLWQQSGDTPMLVHEALREYDRWRHDLPRLWSTLGEMPCEVADGFEHLVRTLGKEGRSAAESWHKSVAEAKEIPLGQLW